MVRQGLAERGKGIETQWDAQRRQGRESETKPSKGEALGNTARAWHGEAETYAATAENRNEMQRKGIERHRVVEIGRGIVWQSYATAL